MTAADQLRALLADIYAGFSNGDATPWTEHTADDVLVIGSDPEEWWQGRDLVSEVATVQMREISSAGGRLAGSEPQIFEQGDVAWVVDRPVLRLGDGRQMPMRVTLIVDFLPGTPRIRHSHFSVGAVNAVVFGQELTTG